MLNILVITPGFLPSIGGAEIGIHEIYRRIGKHHRVTILTKYQKNSHSIDDFDQSKYSVRKYRDFLNFGLVGGRMLLRGSLPPFSVGALYGAVRTISDLRPDVINVHYAAFTGLTALWGQNVCEIPTVLSLIGRDSAPGPLVPKLWPWYASVIARQVAHTVFISAYSQSYYEKFDFPQSVIPYGVDLEKYTPQLPDESLRKELDLSPTTQILFCLQRLARIKHVEVAIYSARILIDRGLNDFVLLIGGIGTYENQLTQLVDSLNLHNHVKFIGYIPEDQLNKYFALADIFVLTSIHETFGIVLAQAMAAGLPVVATNNTAIPEVVLDGRTGLLSPPLDTQTLAENIEILLKDDELRHQMGINGRQRAEIYFDWNKTASDYEQVLKNTVN